MERIRLDKVLQRLGFVDESQIQAALHRQREHGGRLGTNLVESRAITQEQLALALSEQFGVPSIVPGEDDLDRDLVDALPAGFVTEFAVLPLRRIAADGALRLAVADPSNTAAIEKACAILGAASAHPMVAPDAVILRLGARFAARPTHPIELPELFGGEPVESGVQDTKGSDEADLKNVLMISAGVSIKNFLPAVFLREGWRLHVVEGREEFDEVVRALHFDHVLVAQSMVDTFVGWSRALDGVDLGRNVSVFPSVSAALLDNPVPYERTVRSLKQAVRMFAETRGRGSGHSVPYALIAKDVEQLARRCALRPIAIDGLGLALHFLLPGDPFADFEASVEAARRVEFPWKVDAVLERCRDRFTRRAADEDDATRSEVDVAAQILALGWYRHVDLHLQDAPADQWMGIIRRGLRKQAGRLAGVEIVESYLRLIDESGHRLAADDERQILVVGRRSETIRSLGDRLRRIGYQAIDAVDPADAQSMIARRAPAAILFDHESFPDDAENFCRVHGLDPVSLLYVVLDRDDPVATLSLLDAGADDVFSAPSDVDLCVARVDRALRSRSGQEAARARPGQIAATFEAFSFPELMQSLGHGLKSVRIELNRSSGETATMYLQEGRLVHAACGSLRGEDAVYQVIAWQDDGEFVVWPEQAFPEANVRLPLESVLMEGCRILDESLA